jgi:hypothetical protein
MITQPAITCTDCRAPLRDTVAMLFGVCEPCRARWAALAVIGTPSLIHPTDAAREASHGYSVEAELREVGPEPSDLLPNPADWIEQVASGVIPPHDGRRCPECWYPLTEAHDDGRRAGWLLCPVCDTYNTGEDES